MPVGLCGVLIKMSRVLGLIAFANASHGIWYEATCPDSSRTTCNEMAIVLPPAKSIAGR